MNIVSESSDEENIHKEYSQLLDQVTDSHQYNLLQSPEERISIRETYSTLLKFIKEEKKKIATQPSNSFHQDGVGDSQPNFPSCIKELIEKADSVLSSSIRNIQDATFDSQLLRLSAEASLASLEKLDFSSSLSNSPITPGNLISSLDAMITNGGLNLPGLGAKFYISSRTAYFIDFLNGPISILTPVTIRKARTLNRPALSPLVQPDLLDDPVIARKELNADQDASANRIQQIYLWLVAQGSSSSFWEAITHPYSFSRSVENLFHVSFLVKEGKARIFKENDELMLGCWCFKFLDVFGSSVPPVQISLQHCFTLTMENWRVATHYSF